MFPRKLRDGEKFFCRTKELDLDECLYYSIAKITYDKFDFEKIISVKTLKEAWDIIENVYKANVKTLKEA